MLLLLSVCTAAAARDFEVSHYAVVLTPDIGNASVRGQLTLRARAVAAAAHELELDSGELVVTAVHAGALPVAFEQRDAQLRVRLPTPLRQGRRLKLQIDYHGAPRFGLEFAPEREEVYTIFSSSQWMPTLDAPDQRATLDLSVLLPAHLQAAGSGRALPVRTLAGGRRVHRWRLREPMPGYVYGFTAGRYQQARQRHHGITLHYLSQQRSPAELQQIFARTGEMLDFFAQRAGLAYRGDYSQALVARTIGQELAGLSLMSEDYGKAVLDNPDDVALIAHEAAHQWWGNRVTCASWQHFWLNEGMVTFMTAAYLQHAQGEAAYQAQLQRWRTRIDRLRADGRDHALVYADWSQPSADDRAVVYQKGGYVLHQLRQELGEAVFWRGLRAYTRANDGRSVVTADFQQAMERAAGRRLDAFFNQWVYAAGAEAPQDGRGQ